MPTNSISYENYRSRMRKMSNNKKIAATESRLAAVERNLRNGREHKIARHSGEINISNSIGTANLIEIFPDIPQSTTSAGRIGNEVRVKKITIKSWIQYAPGDVNNRVARDQANVMARWLLIKQKDQQSSRGLTATGIFEADQLLESGEFIAANEFRNIMSPINRDMFTVKKDKKLKITNNVDTSDPNNDADANPYNFKVINKTMRFGKTGKKLTFDKEAGTVQPVQFPWVFTAGYCNTNGTTAVANSARMFYDITCYYTDA